MKKAAVFLAFLLLLLSGCAKAPEPPASPPAAEPPAAEQEIDYIEFSKEEAPALSEAQAALQKEDVDSAAYRQAQYVVFSSEMEKAIREKDTKAISDRLENLRFSYTEGDAFESPATRNALLKLGVITEEEDGSLLFTFHDRTLVQAISNGDGSHTLSVYQQFLELILREPNIRFAQN